MSSLINRKQAFQASPEAGRFLLVPPVLACHLDSEATLQGPLAG